MPAKTLRIEDTDERGILVSLDRVLELLDLRRVTAWRLMNVEIIYGKLLGLNPIEVEKATAADGGWQLSSDEVWEIARCDTQIIDGLFVGLNEQSDQVLSVLCFDSSFWEVEVVD